jgi:ATP-dependent Lon protease
MNKPEGYRIGIVGSAGTGKSSFAESLAIKLGIPCLKSKDITQQILVRDGYDYSSGIQIERFLSHTRRQGEILRRTLEQQSVEQFVTDRTVVDLAAYALIEINSDTDTVKHVYETCQKSIAIYTHLFFCPFMDMTAVTDNGRRTLNPWYQKLVHTIERGIMEDWDKDYWLIQSDNIEERIIEVIDILQGF